MTAVTVLTTPARPFTRADLDAMPDDGYRYELLDGMLLVSAAPVPRHQVVSGNLHLLLRAACPAELQVLYAPVDVVLADDTVLEPDLLVAPREQFSAKDLPGAPLLAIEVLSPSTRRVDRLLKRDRYEEAGCPSYWLVDPAEPSVVVLELEEGRYVERGRAGGDEWLEVTLPYAMTIVPADLLA
jgi:Uma2 family endonuclease